MSHKELCYTWVERHKYQHPDGRWQACKPDGEPYGKIYEREEELDELLWGEVISLLMVSLKSPNGSPVEED